jgi:energy-coupling factor transport system permease protein
MKIHQGAWVAWALCAGLAAVATTDPFYLLPLTAVAWAVGAVHRGTGPWVRSFRTFFLFGAAALVVRTALVFLGPVSRGSVAFAALEGLRVAVLLVIFGAFNSVTDPFRLLRLAPRRFHEPALAAALALSIAPRTMVAAAKVREAQRLRGIATRRWRSLPALAVPVLETGMEEAVTLAESMDARGHGARRRTTYRRDRWGVGGWLVLTSAAAGAVLFGRAALAGEPSLTLQTFPLAWPDVSWTLVAAVLLFAAPVALPPGARR